MAIYLHRFSEESEYQDKRENDYYEPWVSLTEEANRVDYNKKTTPGPDLSEPLTFEAVEDNTPILAMFQNMEEESATRTLFYSVDSGATWQSALIGAEPATITTLNAGQTIQLKGDSFCTGGMVMVADMSGGMSYKPFYAYGNIMSLLAAEGFEELTEVPENAFTMFFAGNLINIHPEHPLLLPATTLAAGCYLRMFAGCTSLTAAPELPATTLAAYCYHNMFSNCTSLTAAPELPATTLAADCYHSMFSSCTSLTAAPELHATTLAEGCYHSMFEGCVSLTLAPELSAPILMAGCYRQLFRNCSSLSAVKCLAEDISADYAVTKWLEGVAETGTFTKAAGVNWPTDESGTPYGWTIIEV